MPFSCGSFDKSGVSDLFLGPVCGQLNRQSVKEANATWEALWRAFISIQSELQFGPGQINESCNALTLDTIIHVEFGNLSIALKAR